MNAFNRAQRAYSDAAAPIRTDRGTEYAAISRATRNLKAAADAGPGAFGDLAQALHQNRQLWHILTTSVSDDANQLPQSLRARIFYLGQFTEHQSRKILRGEGSVEPLIEVNTALMRGLGTGAVK